MEDKKYIIKYWFYGKIFYTEGYALNEIQAEQKFYGHFDERCSIEKIFLEKEFHKIISKNLSLDLFGHLENLIK